MSRPRRNAQPKKYTVEESDSDEESRNAEVISNENSDSGEELSTLGESDGSESDASESFPQPLPIATQSDVQRTRAIVTQQLQEITLLKAQIEEQRAIEDEARAELRAAQTLLRKTAAIIAPITRIPPEILGVIFTAHVCENDQSPWPLMQVSRAWRAAALMTRTMWGRILLAPSSWVESKTGTGRVRVYNGMEVCFKEAQLSRALKRAGATQVDLVVVFPYTRGVYRVGGKVITEDYDASRLIDGIPLHQANIRLRSLNVVAEYYRGATPNNLSTFNYVDLTSFTLSGSYPGLLEKVLKESRALRRLEAPWSSLKEFRTCNWWGEIEHFGTSNIYSFEETKSVMAVLLTCKALVSLSFNAGRLSYYNQDVQTLQIPSLKHLKLANMTFPTPWLIDCPNLTHLTLHYFTGIAKLAAGSIILPNLVDLSFSSDGVAETNLRAFFVPSLQKFDLSFGGGKGNCAKILRDLWPARATNATGKAFVSNIEPRSLSLRNTPVNQKVLARSLVGRKQLEELSIVGIDISAEFLDGLLPVPGKGTKKSQGMQVGCPALKRLETDLLIGQKLKPNRSAVRASAAALIAARQQAGAPFERFAIRITREKGWEELVVEDDD